MKSGKYRINKVLYGVFFIIILPALLWLWSVYTNPLIQMPAIQSSFWGPALFIAGLLLMLWGMYAIVRYGNGLPMNAYPPAKLVKQGPYRLMYHPIYYGFGILLIGASIYFGSVSGIWLVTPVTILGMMALVWGYERIQLQKRFPEYESPVFFSLPANVNKKAFWNHRVIAFVLPAFFWITGNALSLLLYDDHISISKQVGIVEYLPFSGEISWLLLLLFLAIPFLRLSQSDLRDWTISSLVAIFLIFMTAVLLPKVGIRYFLNDDAVMGKEGVFMIQLPYFKLLTFHGCLILLLGRIFARSLFRLSLFIWSITLILFVNMLSLSQWPLLNMVSSLIMYLIIIRRNVIWEKLRLVAERIANSWKEWVIGPVRIINHGFYVGVAAFLGVVLSGWLVGSQYVWAIVVFGLVVIVFSALWAQFIEGSEKLKRPYGYYGALVGIIFSSIVVGLMGYDVWVIIGVISVFMPWMQAIGRLRCLINGCCHGSVTNKEALGIRYFHPRSRVCGLSDMKGELLHPTPLYAIVWLFMVGLVLLVLWFRQVSYPMIFGLYLILSGIGRFVEEAYRGEVQTPIVFGLRLYQWTAVVSVMVGAFMTTLKVNRLELEPIYELDILYAGLVLGFFTFLAMGVDFPKSNLRFSRLV
ncbi:hypothetical protein E9993_15985 [Labilibacter sediminis]|nr:hypothetical protein E9993_15985 [Labilibacter sediminis]